MLIALKFAALLTMIGHRIEGRARAAGVALLGRPKFGPVAPVAWVTFGSDIPNWALAPHEIEESEEHVPRHNLGIADEVGHNVEETHFACLGGLSSVV